VSTGTRRSGVRALRARRTGVAGRENHPALRQAQEGENQEIQFFRIIRKNQKTTKTARQAYSRDFDQCCEID
jgi:hypothetical protein